MAILETFPSRDNSHTILDTDGTAVAKEDNLQFTGLDVTDDSTNEKTEVKAVGLNADSLDDVCNGEINTNIVQTGMCYSTIEQVVGKWIDGRPVYQRTLVLSGLTHNVYNTLDFSFDVVINYEGYYVDSRYPTDYNPLTHYVSETYNNFIKFANSNKLYVRGDSVDKNTYYITVKYIKTTS